MSIATASKAKARLRWVRPAALGGVDIIDAGPGCARKGDRDENKRKRPSEAECSVADASGQFQVAPQWYCAIVSASFWRAAVRFTTSARKETTPTPRPMDDMTAFDCRVIGSQ